MDLPDERRSSSVKAGCWVLVGLSGLAVAALVVLVLTAASGDEGLIVQDPDDVESLNLTTTPTTGIVTLSTPSQHEGFCLNESSSNTPGCSEIDGDVRLKNEEIITENVKSIVDYFEKFGSLNEIKDNLSRAYGTLMELFFKCKNRGEKDLKGISVVQKLFSKVGGWPLLREEKENQPRNVWEIERLFIELNLKEGGLIKLKFALTKDGNYLIKIRKPDLKTPRNESEVLKYFIYKTELAKFFGVEDDEQIWSKLIDVLNFEKRIYQLNQTTEYHVNKSAHLSLDDLKSETAIPWDTLLSSFKDYSKFQYELEDRAYLNTLRDMIGNNEVAADFLLWRLAEQLVPYISNKTFHSLGKSSDSGVDDSCLETVPRHTVPAIFKKYYAQYVKKIKEEVENITRSIIQEIIRGKQDNTMREKLNKTTIYVGYPENLIHPELNKYYGEFYEMIGFNDSDSYLEAQMKLSKWSNENLPMKNKEFVEWMDFEDLTRPTATYNEERNYIVINIGLLVEPYYKSSMSLTEKYASLGYTVAEALIKVIDSQACPEWPCHEVVRVAREAQLKCEDELNKPSPGMSTTPSMKETSQTTMATSSVKETSQTTMATSSVKETSQTTTSITSVTTTSQLSTSTSQPDLETQIFFNQVAMTMCRNIAVSTIDQYVTPLEEEKVTKIIKSFVCSNRTTPIPTTTTVKLNTPDEITTKDPSTTVIQSSSTHKTNTDR